MVMLFPEQHRLQLCSDIAFWNTWIKVSMAAITLKRKLGSPLLATPHSFLIPQPHVLPSVCTPTALSKWRHRIKSWSAGNMKCVQGRSRHIPGTSRLEGSEPTRQLLWAQIHCLGEPIGCNHHYKVPSTPLSGDKPSVFPHYQSLNHHYTPKSYFLSNPCLPK